MHYAEIKYYDIANGVGVRTSLFVSGCRRRCPGCFNMVAWDFDYGYEFDDAIQEKILESLAPSYIRGLTLLGGEPLEPENQKALVPFLKRMRAELPKKDVWVFSGFTWEELLRGEAGPQTSEFISLVDVMVDGPFVDELHDITLRFRGSANQRIIDVAASLAAGEPLAWHDDPVFATRGMEGWIGSHEPPTDSTWSAIHL